MVKCQIVPKLTMQHQSSHLNGRTIDRPSYVLDGTEVEVTLRPTVSRPVHPGVLPLLEQVTRCYIYLNENYILFWRAASYIWDSVAVGTSNMSNTLWITVTTKRFK
jgi:hypothetical protein